MVVESPVGAREAARMIGIHQNTLRRVSPRDLPYFTINPRGDRRYRPEDIRHFMEVRYRDD